MEEFAEKFPVMAGRARSIHTYETMLNFAKLYGFESVEKAESFFAK